MIEGEADSWGKNNGNALQIKRIWINEYVLITHLKQSFSCALSCDVDQKHWLDGDSTWLWNICDPDWTTFAHFLLLKL